jgi:hypothetical protein
MKDNIMKVILIFITLTMILCSGCITIAVPEPENKAPTAYIDSITPEKATVGESILFTGHGTDTDGTIVGYEWRSNLDGALSTVASFKTASLSSGSHSISLRVLDNRNLWSSDVAGTVVVAPKVVKPEVKSFVASPSSIVRGGAIELRWSVLNAQTVFIDNSIGQVSADGSKILYPSANTTYTLTASNEGSSTIATISVTVQESATVGNPVISFTAQHLGGTSWQLNWNVLYATQIVIEPDIGLVNPTGNRVVTLSSGQTKQYRLTAKNDWGWAYWQVLLVAP